MSKEERLVGVLYFSQTVEDVVVSTLKDQGVKLKSHHYCEAREGKSRTWLDRRRCMYIIAKGKFYKVWKDTLVPKEVYERVEKDSTIEVPVIFQPRAGKKGLWASDIHFLLK